MSEEKRKTTPEEAEVKETEAETQEEVAPEAPEEASEETNAEEGQERYVRLMAEFQNYKKRVAKEKSDIHAYANEKVIVDLLSVLDNFERALANDPGAEAEGYAKGMTLIFEELKGVLTKAGLAEVEALGEPFDPACHHAVMTEESEEYESEHVCNVLQKGYRLNSKVIRPAMVAVAK